MIFSTIHQPVTSEAQIESTQPLSSLRLLILKLCHKSIAIFATHDSYRLAISLPFSLLRIRSSAKPQQQEKKAASKNRLNQLCILSSGSTPAFRASGLLWASRYDSSYPARSRALSIMASFYDLVVALEFFLTPCGVVSIYEQYAMI